VHLGASYDHGVAQEVSVQRDVSQLDPAVDVEGGDADVDDDGGDGDEELVADKDALLPIACAYYTVERGHIAADDEYFAF